MMLKFLEQLSINTPLSTLLKKFSKFIFLTIIWQIVIACYSQLLMPSLIKNLPSEIKKNKLKAGVFLGLSAYWGLILIGTLITQFN